MVQRACETCGTVFFVPPSRIRSERAFCGRACYAKKRVRRITPALEQRILDTYAAGASGSGAKEIADCSKGYFYQILHRHNVELRSLSESHQRYALDKHYFDSIDTEEKAWLLGFIAADGCIHRNVLSIALAQRDTEILEKIRSCLRSGHQIEQIACNGESGTPAVRLSISNLYLAAGLRAAGITERKSLTAEAWQGPAELLRHYWRGVWDGDGWLTEEVRCKKDSSYPVWDVGVCGSLPMMQTFARFVEPIVGHLPGVKPNNSIFMVRFHGNKQPRIVVRLLYEEAVISLERKRLLAAELLSTKGHQDVNPIIVPGMPFGRLRVIERTEKRSKVGQTIYRCLCSCGSASVVGKESRESSGEKCRSSTVPLLFRSIKRKLNQPSAQPTPALACL